MPYRRRGYAKRRSYKKRSSRWGTYKAAGSQLWRDVKWLKSVVNVEKKYSDVVSTGAAVSSTATLVLLNGLATGDDSINRNGDSVKIVSDLLRIKSTIHASATGTTLRCIVVIDKQCNGAAPTIGNILESGTNILSPLGITWGKRFIVLLDKYMKLNQDTPETSYRYFKKLSMHTRYGNDTAAVSSIATNSLYLVLMSDEATNTPTVEYYNRIRFIDN